VAAFGPIDILVNNAAVFGFKALPEIDEPRYRHIFDTNVLGMINISSLPTLGNVSGSAGSAVYSASKAAVNAIMPGYFDTEGARATGAKGSGVRR
jgi:3-oxoacyl-[acyl-carrier protein] reductase